MSDIDNSQMTEFEREQLRLLKKIHRGQIADRFFIFFNFAVALAIVLGIFVAYVNIKAQYDTLRPTIDALSQISAEDINNFSTTISELSQYDGWENLGEVMQQITPEMVEGIEDIGNNLEGLETISQIIDSITDKLNLLLKMFK